MAAGDYSENGDLRLPRFSADGMDGDDEKEDDDVNVGDRRANGDDDEEEPEEEEVPRLKYQRMGGTIPLLLKDDVASSIVVAERLIALGTHSGTVHILDFQGNQVREFSAHTATVNDISVDSEGEFVASCSDDGQVVINNLYTDEKLKFEYHRPMKAVALDPGYARKSSFRFVTGGLAGQLFLNLRTWFGNRDQVLHFGEGPIHGIKWRTSLIAWANDVGVKIYDMDNNQRVAFIERPKGSPRPELLLPSLVWQDDSILIIGWGTTVKIAAIRSAGSNPLQVPIPSGGKHIDIVASFQTSYYISGIAPYGDDLVVLAYISEAGEAEVEHGMLSLSSRQGTAQRPEVRVVTWKNIEFWTDALSIHGFEHYKAKDYSLACAPLAGSSYAGSQWAAGDEPLYYIVSPKDIVIAKPRGVEDHVSWLLERGLHEKALEAVESTQARKELLDEVGNKYLDHLMLEKKYAEAAALCPKLLRGSASSWERWVFQYAHVRQLPVLVPYIPTDNPRLPDTVYEMSLLALATSTSYHRDFLSTVKAWPSNIYSAASVISAVEPQLKMATVSESLKEALAELYLIDKQYDRALGMYAELRKPELFDFIERHNLQDAVSDKVAHLMALDCKRAVSLFIQHKVAPLDVVNQLLGAKNEVNFRYFIYLYLHSLFEVDPNAGRDFHDLQVELYAEYEPKMLIPFLRSSQHYRLDKAYEICLRKDLVAEQVFILGRMGNTKQALSLLINKLENMEEAIEFVTAQNDKELWEELIKLSFSRPEMIGKLLEHTVGNLDPLYIVNMVPNGVHIPRLRDHLVKVITDYRTETSLRQGCNDILKADCVNLLVRYFNEARHAIYINSDDDTSRGKRGDDPSTSRPLEKVGNGMMGVKSRMRGGGRCCICLDPLAIQEVPAMVFFCCHAYHITCLLSSSNAANMNISKTGVAYQPPEYNEDEEEEEDYASGTSWIRCILCTTAVS